MKLSNFVTKLGMSNQKLAIGKCKHSPAVE